MKRKQFISAIITGSTILALYPLWKYRNLFLSDTSVNYGKRKLVLIELNGGNDSLNTVIPLDKYKQLLSARADIVIPEKKILRLNNANIWGLHPSMSGLQSLYNDGLVTFVHGVGSPVEEFSHFQARAMKYAANTTKEEVRSGWMGRFLYQKYPNYPTGYPNHIHQGPAAVRLGAVSPRITQFFSSANNSEEDISIGISNFENLNEKEKLPENNMGEGIAGMNLEKIHAVSKQLSLYSPVIKNFAQKQSTLSKLYPVEGVNKLADQLKLIARLIGSGMDTPVYIVSHSGYDTHADQVDKSDSTKGDHAKLLRELSEAITAFTDDLHLMNKQDEVLGMTFSEFGRRIKSGSYGTDHGTAESVILFGSKLKGGIIGESPDLSDKITYEDNLPVQYDYRALYKDILGSWLGATPQELNETIPENTDVKLNLFNNNLS